MKGVVILRLEMDVDNFGEATSAGMDFLHRGLHGSYGIRKITGRLQSVELLESREEEPST